MNQFRFGLSSEERDSLNHLCSSEQLRRGQGAVRQISTRKARLGQRQREGEARLLVDDQVEQDLDITLVALFDEFETVVKRPVRRVNVSVVRDIVPLYARTVMTMQNGPSDRARTGKQRRLRPSK
jgi:hypothetical protein